MHNQAGVTILRRTWDRRRGSTLQHDSLSSLFSPLLSLFLPHPSHCGMCVCVCVSAFIVTHVCTCGCQRLISASFFYGSSPGPLTQVSHWSWSSSFRYNAWPMVPGPACLYISILNRPVPSHLSRPVIILLDSDFSTDSTVDNTVNYKREKCNGFWLLPGFPQPHCIRLRGLSSQYSYKDLFGVQFQASNPNAGVRAEAPHTFL